MSHDKLLEELQQRTGYTFHDPQLLREAMTHASSASTRRESNERLEFLGDAVLGLVVCQSVFQRLPDSLEGELTKVKSAVVSRKICARVAERLHLTQPLILGQGMDSNGELPKSLAAGVFEAFVGAIFLDGGLAPARRFILANMSAEIEHASRSEHQFNFKSQLQQYAQRFFESTPSYELLDEKGPDHSKCFEVAVNIGVRRYKSAWGPSKKEAEQKAARRALVEVGALPDNGQDDYDE